ncbi:hypothetical protein HDV00_010256 [Rhizophlyctis rosea]|nr:hypothetical protein HDV00_010256 [Rhizophlyctis rosea]
MAPPAFKAVVSFIALLTALGWMNTPERWEGLKSSDIVREWRRKQTARMKRAPIPVGADPRTAGGCASPPLGKGLQVFNAVVLNEWNGSEPGGSVGGRLLSLSSAHLTNWTLGTSIFPQPQSCADLERASIYSSTLTSLDSLTFRNGSIFNGHATTTTTSRTSDVGKDVVDRMEGRGCTVRVVNGSEMRVEGQGIRDVESDMRGIAELARSLPGSLTLGVHPQMTGRLTIWMPRQRDTEVAHFGVDALTNVKAIALTMTGKYEPVTTIILNVYPSRRANDKVILSNLDTATFTHPSRVLWNVLGIPTLVLENTEIFGTILAPDAHIGKKLA